MADSRRSPHADDPSCDGGGDNSSMSLQESEDTEGYSPAAPPPSVHNSGQPVRSIFVNELPSDGPTIGAASSSAWGSDEDEDAKITDKTASPFLLGPRSSSSPMGASDSNSDGDGERWIGFSDRAGGEASTSTSSPDAYDYRTFFGDPHSYVEMRDQILRHSFWRHEDEACDDFSMVLQTSQNGSRKILEKEPLSSLPAEFVYKVMKDKSNMLLANYSEYRKVSGDGSCFYRSFIYSYLEQLVKASPDEELRLLGALEPMQEKFQRLHWPDSYADGYNAFVGLILECMERKQRMLSVSDYENWLFQESENEWKFAKIISYLRLLTAIEMSTEAEKFRHFITDLDPENPDVAGWCRQHVIPMPEEVEEFHVVALIDVLHVPVRIVNVDISDTVEPYTHNIYESPDALPCVTLLYRPGHYDILY
uniref:Uncharacterized protein n=1 Tax=Avena sativa TaxID=4498 RepID=A0ACD6ADZ0_AVESA